MRRNGAQGRGVHRKGGVEASCQQLWRRQQAWQPMNRSRRQQGTAPAGWTNETAQLELAARTFSALNSAAGGSALTLAAPGLHTPSVGQG